MQIAHREKLVDQASAAPGSLSTYKHSNCPYTSTSISESINLRYFQQKCKTDLLQNVIAVEAISDTGKQVKNQAELLQPQQEGISPLEPAPETTA